MHSSTRESRKTGRTGLKRMLTLLFPLAVFAFAVACGSDSGGPAASGGDADDSLASVSTTLYVDRSFTFDDFVAVGWKKSRQFPTDTVPGSTDIWYGFFDQKDIEVRFYNSHEDASTLGVESASSAIDQAFREGGQVGASNRGAGSSAVTKYKAFAVVGDTVILCELNVDTCRSLADALAAG